MTREHKLNLSLIRGMCLCDHMGDVWDDIYRWAALLGIDVPMDELEEEPDIDKLEAMGAVGLYDKRWKDDTQDQSTD